MRTVENLMKMDGRVFVYLSNNVVRQQFLENAESEGFTFGNGVRPTEGRYSDIYVVDTDRTLHHPGAIGHYAFHYPKRYVSAKMIRIDYEKYVSDQDDYEMRY